MKKISVLTGTRAEYHLMYPVLKKIVEHPDLELDLIVTGAHLSAKYGNTYQAIEKDGIPISIKLPILKDDEEIVDMIGLLLNVC